MPPKTNLFIWLDVEKKVLTWHMLRKRVREGPSILLFCRDNAKTTQHLFLLALMHVKYEMKSKVVWGRITLMNIFMYGSPTNI